MGVLVGDEKTLLNGMTITNFVISVGGKCRNIEKTNITSVNEETKESTTTTVYRTWYQCSYYISQAAYEAQAEPITTSFHELDMTAAQLNGNVFDVIYSQIKGNYSTTTDI